MTEAQKLLEMIEAVDPTDKATMDEIDARVWCWLNGKVLCGAGRFDEFKGLKPTSWGENTIVHFAIETVKSSKKQSCKKYSRSRDALKAIRPDGYKVQISIHEWGSYFKDYPRYKNESDWLLTPNYSTDDACPYNNLSPIRSPRLPTECLAELHAIIQSISWERLNGK